jgi:hypothetical protein
MKQSPCQRLRARPLSTLAFTNSTLSRIFIDSVEYCKLCIVRNYLVLATTIYFALLSVALLMALVLNMGGNNDFILLVGSTLGAHGPLSSTLLRRRSQATKMRKAASKENPDPQRHG